jgi:hypothetical protein
MATPDGCSKHTIKNGDAENGVGFCGISLVFSNGVPSLASSPDRVGDIYAN